MEMNSGKYIPNRGDIIWVDLSPTLGREQSGKRPALVLSKKSYNKSSQLLLACPIISQIKGYPFEVILNGKITGVVLSDQVRSISFTKRMLEYAETVSQDIITEVAHKINLVLP